MATGQQHILLTGQIDRQALVMGSYEPDDARTGVPSGTTLTPMTGSGPTKSVVVTTAGALYQGIDLDGWFDVRAPNVTIRRCRIRGSNTVGFSYGLVHATNSAVRNLLIEDCTLACDPTTIDDLPTGVLGHDYTLRRCRIYDVIDGAGIFNVITPGDPSNVVVEANYIGPLAWFQVSTGQVDGSHNDCVQMQGGVGAIYRWNKLWCYNSLTPGIGNAVEFGGRNGPTQTQGLSCFMMNSTIGDPYDVQIYENWCYGGEVAFNFTDSAIGADGETIAIVHRNRFKQNSAWYKDVDPAFGGIWYWSSPISIWDFDFGGPNKNYWMDSGLEVGYWEKTVE